MHYYKYTFIRLDDKCIGRHAKPYLPLPTFIKEQLGMLLGSLCGDYLLT